MYLSFRSGSVCESIRLSQWLLAPLSTLHRMMFYFAWDTHNGHQGVLIIFHKVRWVYPYEVSLNEGPEYCWTRIPSIAIIRS